MASNERAIINNLNERARHFAGPNAPQLTIYDVRHVLDHYGRKCLNCGAEPAVSLDHVKPLALGGENILENIQDLCIKCQKVKGVKEIDYRNGNICHHLEPQDYNYDNDTEESGEETELSEISGKSVNGGRRFGAGRKPREVTILKRRLVHDKIEEAEASFAYIVAVRDNPDEPSAQRLAAAESILDRVLGKPAIMQPSAGDELYKAHLKRLKEVIFGNESVTASGGVVMYADPNRDANELNA